MVFTAPFSGRSPFSCGLGKCLQVNLYPVGDVNMQQQRHNKKDERFIHDE